MVVYRYVYTNTKHTVMFVYVHIFICILIHSKIICTGIEISNRDYLREENANESFSLPIYCEFKNENIFYLLLMQSEIIAEQGGPY